MCNFFLLFTQNEYDRYEQNECKHRVYDRYYIKGNALIVNWPEQVSAITGASIDEAAQAAAEQGKQENAFKRKLFFFYFS